MIIIDAQKSPSLCVGRGNLQNQEGPGLPAAGLVTPERAEPGQHGDHPSRDLRTPRHPPVSVGAWAMDQEGRRPPALCTVQNPLLSPIVVVLIVLTLS